MHTYTANLTRAFFMIAALIAAPTLLSPPSANAAGEYTVDGTCSAWAQIIPVNSSVAAYPQCPSLVVRNAISGLSGAQTAQGTSGGWRFDPPPGVGVRRVNLGGTLLSGDKWRSRIYNVGPNGVEHTLVRCPDSGGCSTGLGSPAGFDLVGPVLATVTCSTASCPNDGPSPRGKIEIKSSKITLFDPTPPVASLAGGALSDGGWHGGTAAINVSGSDNTGIRYARALVDGDARFGPASEQTCDYSRPTPCTNHEGMPVAVDLRGLPDGTHTLTAQVEDAAGNIANTGDIAVNVDNTPPAAPQSARLVGGQSWRKQNTFGVTWTNAAQAFAPIAGANYRLCPAGEPQDSASCKSGSVGETNITRLGFQVPGPGEWTLRLWLHDAAGNSSADNSATIEGIRLVAGRISESGGRRAPSHLSAGRQTRVKHAKKKHGKRHPRPTRRLTRNPTLRLGTSTLIRGRLVGARHRGLAGQRLLVYRRTRVQGARFVPAGSVVTGRRGGWAFRARRGPSRTLEIVYPGSASRQGRIALVHLNVRAKLKIRRDRGTINNGDYVSLSGRLKGGNIPPGGALLELQVRSRHRWRPFATPRTDAKGVWSYPYKFETVTSGVVQFKFRAVLRKQATYPFTAKSRLVRVRVRGAG